VLSTYLHTFQKDWKKHPAKILGRKIYSNLLGCKIAGILREYCLFVPQSVWQNNE